VNLYVLLRNLTFIAIATSPPVLHIDLWNSTLCIFWVAHLKIRLKFRAHIVRAVAEGYDAEIDSYVDSDEYQTAFGENVVPYNRGTSSTSNAKQIGYNRMFALDRGAAQVDSAVQASQLVYAVATNSTSVIKPSTSTVIGSGTEKRFKILVSGSKFDTRRRVSRSEYIVSASKMTPQIQRINRTSGKIVSITEVA
jgi:phycoerythrin-associated linker protein